MVTEAQTAEAKARTARKAMVGIVISDKREKTIAVEVKRLVKHPRYGKYIYRSTICHAHDEKNEAKKGDRVEIMETRPLSKQKRWRLMEIVDRAEQLVGPEPLETAEKAKEEAAIKKPSEEEQKPEKQEEVKQEEGEAKQEGTAEASAE